MSDMQGNIIASIDIGSNSAHLVVARVDSREEIEILDSDKVTTRLAGYLSENRYLSQEGLEICLSALHKLVKIARTHTENIRCVATYTVRAAKNKKKLLALAKSQIGIDIEVVNGREEAWLEFLGVDKGLKIEVNKTVLVDIGGGSTEVSLHKENAEDFLAQSLDLGAVTLTAKFFPDGKYSPKKIKHLIAHIQRQCAGKISQNEFPFQMAVASSGTAKAAAKIISKKFHDSRNINNVNGYNFTVKELYKLRDLIFDCRSTKEICDALPIEESRSEIIVAGIAILCVLSELLGVTSWTTSTYSLREGLVIDTYRRWFSSEGKKYGRTRLQSIRRLADRFRIDPEKGRMILEKTMAVYSRFCQDPEFLSAQIENEELLLQAACYLCETGKCISFSKYHKHSAYIVQNSDIIGFTQPELLIIGYVIRFHRKAVVSVKKLEEHPTLIPLLNRIRILSLCLRIGVAMNRTWQSTMMYSKLDIEDTKLIFTFPRSFEDKFKVELDNLINESAASELCVNKSIEIRHV